jgi:hypothetical protein
MGIEGGAGGFHGEGGGPRVEAKYNPLESTFLVKLCFASRCRQQHGKWRLQSRAAMISSVFPFRENVDMRRWED